MMTKRKIQMLIDLIMIALLPVLMAYEMVGAAAHEWLGIVMFLLFILHHVINRQWHKNLLKGRYSAVRIFGAVINALLFIIMISQAASGIMMARHISTILPTGGGMSFARSIHLLGGYWGFVLMSVHLGCHWNRVLGVMRKVAKTAKPSATNVIILRTAAAVLAAYGVVAFFQRQIGTYMFFAEPFCFL